MAHDRRSGRERQHMRNQRLPAPSGVPSLSSFRVTNSIQCSTAKSDKKWKMVLQKVRVEEGWVARGSAGETRGSVHCQGALAGDEGRQCVYNIHLHGFKAKGAHAAEPGKPLANLQGWLMTADAWRCSLGHHACRQPLERRLLKPASASGLCLLMLTPWPAARCWCRFGRTCRRP